MRTPVVGPLALVLFATPAAARSPYILPDGVNRAPAVTLHCATATGTAIACGTAANPLVVSTPAGASAANQSAQIGAEQATAQGVGTVNDAAFTGGSGSMVSLLKALWSVASAGIPALPTGGALTSRSLTLPAGVSTQVFAANGVRRYLSFQVPLSGGVWVNVMGGPAQPNGPDCAYFAAGSFYESGAFINRGAITVYSSASVMFSAWES